MIAPMARLVMVETPGAAYSVCMNISGTTRVFLVVGDPVIQVQAPAIFNRIFQRHGLDAVLVPAQVPAADFPAFARQVLRAGNISGLWLTIPHKTALVAELADMDSSARVAQSVNAVRRAADGRLEGALFDGTGLVAALRHLGIEPRGLRVLLLGTGGAGAAIATALLENGVATLALHDLGTRAQALADRLGGLGAGRLQVQGSDPAGFDLVVHATPLGLREDDPLPFDVARLDPGARVIDILMKHAPTRLLRACAARGIEAHPGFEMLVQQVPDYLDFFGMPDAARALRTDLSEVRQALLAD
jgi:shikimate dehydrogenase